MAVYTGSGVTFAIATGANANSRPTDAAGYAALTWTTVGEVETIGEFGDTANLVTFLALADARVRKRKGSRNGGTLAVMCGHDPLDAGQVALRAAQASSFGNNFRIVYADKADSNDTNSIAYFHGQVMGTPNAIGGPDDISKLNCNIEIDSAITYVAATVVP